MTVRVWDANSGRLVQGPLRGHENRVYFVAFSNGTRIVSVAWGGKVCVWDITTGAVVSGPSQRHANNVLTATFIPNSAFLSVSSDGKWIVRVIHKTRVQILDSSTGQVVMTTEAHSGAVSTVTFYQIASGSSQPLVIKQSMSIILIGSHASNKSSNIFVLCPTVIPKTELIHVRSVDRYPCTFSSLKQNPCSF